ncbi:hypothetical protein BCR44DRAFT_1423363 [Catenaria anguillulae PL171]|uniref:Uncharacterized protein n=1 Tax=Catenaria anguillulae PL171 TaxID=765915 RepID=A0A1Y2I4B5_9FUNG|nr:hypothetical protein BCR44DRAFT_1423363 [Catenaria anguillulae PL171]
MRSRFTLRFSSASAADSASRHVSNSFFSARRSSLALSRATFSRSSAARSRDSVSRMAWMSAVVDVDMDDEDESRRMPEPVGGSVLASTSECDVDERRRGLDTDRRAVLDDGDSDDDVDVARGGHEPLRCTPESASLANCCCCCWAAREAARAGK